MTSGSMRYGYLAFERVHGGIVTLPDEEPQLFEDYAEAERAWHKWVQETGLPKAKQKVSEERKAFSEGCRVHERKIKEPGLLTPDRIIRELHDADGSSLGNVAQGGFDAAVEAAALKKFPEPHAGNLPYGDRVGNQQVVVWAVGLYLDGKYKRLPAFTNWTFGFPIDGALEILNQLTAEGWSVAHVSEDRGIYKGQTNQTDSAVTKTRYLLTRNP
jgi:hypothetical protein